jgi:hypothetical protein
MITLIALTVACARPAEQPAPIARIQMTGPLIAATVTMKAAWEFPRNPLVDKALDTSRLSEEIRRGFRLFTNTPAEAPRLAPGGMSCSNCHMNAGQREKSLPLVDVAGMFPEYNRRAARLFSLGDRITDCFLRSENATGVQLASDELPTPTSSEVLAISAYLTWLSRGAAMGKNPSWRGQNAIARRLAVPDLTTTVLTLTVTGLVADTSSWSTSVRRLVPIAAMLGGAFAGGAMLRWLGLAAPLWVAAALLISCAVTAQAATRNPQSHVWQ